MAVVASLVGIRATDAAAAGCFGKQATITGTSKRDVIRGTSRADVIASLGGSDIVVGRGGNDRICTGRGDDSARGQGGKDRLNGGGGEDGLAGEGGKDLIVGGGGFDLLVGGPGNDRLKAGGGVVDLLLGGAGNDRLDGGGGQDIMLGGGGNDRLNGGASDFDVASFFFSPAGVIANLATGVATGEGTDTLVGVEGLEGSPLNDSLTGNDGFNFFWDTLGDDLMDGAGGFDLASFFASEAPVTANLATDSATGQGTDSIPNIEDLAGTFQSGDSLTGDVGPNILIGFDGDDSLNGAEDDDVLDGGNGTDTGDGGTHVSGDRCLSIEVPTDCEVFARTATERSVTRAAALPAFPAVVASRYPIAR
jgi:Ca2+-binding RTX toxin-like protein